MGGFGPAGKNKWKSAVLLGTQRVLVVALLGLPEIEQQPGLVPNEIDYLWPMFTLAGCFVCSLPCFFVFLLFHFLYPFHSSNTQFIQYVLFPGHYAELHGDVEMPQM